MITIKRMIPGDCNILLSQSPHEPDQLVSKKPKNVPEGALVCFSQAPCLLISCISYNTRGVDPGTAAGICYGTDSFLFGHLIL